jgi:hypothetical protein
MNHSNNPNRTFAIGDVVSMGFNGDMYPVGTVSTISKTGKKVITSTGRIAWRDHNGFYKISGTFALIHGVHNKLNPHF